MPIDANIYPTVYFKMPEQHKIPISKTLFGEDWVWLNGAIDKIQKHPSKTHDFSIFMGGADPVNLTLKALQDIVFKYQEVKKIIVITGPLYKYQKALNEFIENTKHQVTYFESMNNYHFELLRANYTLIAFGLSSQELASLGQACILYTHNTEHHHDMENYLLANGGKGSTSRERWLQGFVPTPSAIKKRVNVGKNIVSLVESLS
jgi:spore coat polysaccharide biosynthesis predicted glycosyltransferase SpsG